jgi:NTE family protein
MAFHLGCLRALNDLGLLERVGALSTISGGSVIGAYYAYTPQKTFTEFESDIRAFLRTGFQRSILVELAKPSNLFRCFGTFVRAQAEEKLALIAKRQPTFQRSLSRTDMFANVLEQKVFSGLTMTSAGRPGMDLVIGACELRTGSAFRFSNSKCGSWRHGEMASRDVAVAFAVAASAAYPVFLPALDRTFEFIKSGERKTHRVLLTDGGVYDNLGIQVLEPGRDPGISLHTFPCNYLIACNAGQGQEWTDGMTLGFMTRVARSFEIVHRRVQDSTMHRLHHLNEAGLIKGFALPYLGQLDNRLPWKPPHLVPRGDVVNYPTDFAAMNEIWIDKLSNRGEQLTRLLVGHYLGDALM